MRLGCKTFRKSSIVAGCLLLALQMSLAQNKTAGSADATRGILLQKAHALESRGRPDMAIQIWQQILLSDPKNTEALAGLAKDYKLTGSPEKSSEALDRLRAINPNDPNITRIEDMASMRSQSEALRQAGELASQGKLDDAMRIYRELFGNHPPDGDIALAYYQTLAGASGGKEAAVVGMRAQVERNPGDPRYPIALGSILTYDVRTRAEGIRILKEYHQDPTAQAALRQALVWDSANPASADELRQYLKDHPQDTELSGRLKEDERKLAQMNSGIARTTEERAAFAALNAHRLDEAQNRFSALLEKEPNNGRLAAGMGFLRMQQNNFGGAISYLTQAEQNGYKTRIVEDGLLTSRFWYTMGEATKAFDDNKLDVAGARYRAALEMRPRSPEALNGLAGLLTRQQRYSAAAGIYEQLIKVQPGSTDAWRGLFLAYAREDQNQKALAVSARFPASVKTALASDPEYLRTLATVYHAQNRIADAQRVLALALTLPFPGNGASLKTDTRLQYAGILMEGKRYDQAAVLYLQVLTADLGNQPAWMGLIAAHHELGQDNQALADVQKMPPATYEAALADPGFLSMLGAMYQQANQFEIAQGFLERSARLQIAAGRHPSLALQLQLAAIYLQRNNPTQAYEIYHKVLKANPDRADAWKGLIDTLQATNRNAEAIQQLAFIPAPVRKQLDADIDFLQTEASLYAASGDIPRAVEIMNRVESRYVKLKILPPADIDVQNAWLLFNTRNDRALYPALMRLGGRKDLTVAQRETVQDIWANWSVRRAGIAMDNGNVSRAVDILDAASQAFPDNMTVRKAVAGGFMRVGRAKESLALFKTVPMQDATAGDFQGAIGAALAANDRNHAELWLRQALDRYPRDPAILSLAARFEQVRGDNQRAADYYRAALAAMPLASPTDRLAHTLVYPDQDRKSHRAVTAADLQQLLNPDYEPFSKTTRLPPLPAYGPDPYNGSAPVILTPSRSAPQPAPQPAPQDTPRVNAPSSGNQPSSAPDSNPAITAIPAAQSASPQIFFRQSEKYVDYPGSIDPEYPQLRLRNASSQYSIAQAQIPDQSNPQSVQLSANAPHSLASDAWKGLVFSLMAGNRNAEALQEIQKMPADVRRQLESDVDFVQGEASLFAALGDTQRALETMNRVDDFYLLRRDAPPAGMEIQRAWLLYNIKDDRVLYPLMLRLDTRRDMTAAQRQQVDTLWANWAVRRAFSAMDNGYTLRGVQILQAASEQYPDDLGVRRAVAGAYSKVGRYADSLTLFKTIPMQDAGSGDFQGAIGAALAATDMAQAETWLRQALERFPGDPQILGLAARFEQARGNNQRAADFWRAALAAMPPGSDVQSLDNGLVYPPGAYHAPVQGDLKRLLDPRNDPPARTTKEPPLPSYPGTFAPHASVPPQNQWLDSPSANPLPLSPPTVYTPGNQPNPGTQTNPPATAPSAAPIYVPQSMMQGTPSVHPFFLLQSATQDAVIQPAISTTQAGKPARAAPQASSNPSGGSYTGRMNLPPSEENIDSTGAPAQAPEPQTNWTPSLASRNSHPVTGLRITSQPMNSMATQAQALFAEQTDSQLTQGSATAIHALPNASTEPPANLSALPTGAGLYSMAQYTPSAQEAATGAYSAPKQQGTPQQTAPQQTAQQQANQQQTASQQTASQQTAPQLCPQPQQCAQPPTKPPALKHAKKKKKTTEAAPTLGQQTTPAPTPTLDRAPAEQQYPEQIQAPAEVPAEPAPATTGAGLTDEELMQRNLPPLRGPWVRIQREARPLSPREEAEMQLHAIESGYSGWLGAAGILNYRSGDPGYNELAALEAPFEASAPLGYNARITFVAKPVFLDSGQANGNSVLTVLGATSPGAPLSLVPMPQPIGSLVPTSSTPPAQQNASGLAGEVQLAFPHLALAGGYTPYGFLVATFTGRAQWRPGNGPITFNFVRDSIKDTQLSYSGLRDPKFNTLGSQGQIWGGVIANQGNVQIARGNAEAGIYLGAGGQYITGYQVENNIRIDGLGGGYWRLKTVPEYGNLSIGANFFAMHYSHNEDAFTYGMGGYFSPQSYFLANIPFTWTGHYLTRWHYNIVGSLGVQAFQENSTPLYPLLSSGLENTTTYTPPYTGAPTYGDLALPAKTSVGPNYDVRGQTAYQISPHWFAGGFFGANNSRNYAAVSAGFYVRFLFRSQPSTVAGPTGLFPMFPPNDGLRPFTVP
ncbi:MAG: cellulose synthase subunit BcsC-related outer membrane protein [Terracidiphilus sp.]